MLRFGLALLASVLLLWFGTGLQPAWLLTWLAPVPVLLVAPRVPRTQAALLALLAWFLGGLNMWSFFQVLELPRGVALTVVAVPAVVFAGAVLLYRALFLRRAHAWAALALPAAWVSFEHAMAKSSPHGTYGNLAYTQMDLLPLVQLASVTGLWGVSFVALLVPGLLAAFVERRARVLELFAAAAQRAGVTLVVGLQDSGPPQDRNVALVFAPDGRLAGTYVKHHPIPHFEGENASGTETLLVDQHPDWGVQICKDLDFPELSRRYARAGARLMLVPAWDFGADGWLHSRMAVMRGVEGGFTVVRAARNGLLTVSDDRGRVLWQVESRPSFTQASLETPLGEGQTFYARHGDWFAWACLLLLAAALVRLARAGRERPA